MVLARIGPLNNIYSTPQLSAVAHMKLTTQLVLSLSVALCGFGLATAASAQTTIDPLEDLRTNDNSNNPFEGSGNSAQTGIFDLIHNSVLSNGTSREEFNEARSENIEEQAGSFREQQRRLLNQNVQGDAAQSDAASNRQQ